MDSPVFLGIDPSLRGTSVTETDAAGETIRVRRVRLPKLKELDLLDGLEKGLQEILAEKRSQPVFGSIEDLSLNSPFFVYGQYFLQGVFRLALKRSGIPFVIVSPAKVKSFLSVGKKQDKESVRSAAEKLWPKIEFAVKFKDDNDIDSFLLSRMGAISHALLTQSRVPEMDWMTEKQIELFHGEPVKKSRGRYKGMKILSGIIQRPDFLVNWDGPKEFGWADI